MKFLLVRLLATAGLLWVLMQLFPGRFDVTNGLTGLAVVMLVLGLLNAVARPVLSLLTLPVALLSGLIASLLVNLGLLLLCARLLEVTGLDTRLIMTDWTVTFAAAAAMGLLHWLLKR